MNCPCPFFLTWRRYAGPLICLLVIALLSGCKRAPMTEAQVNARPTPASTGAPQIRTNTLESLLVSAPKSFFSTNVADGRDPFFPDSSRRVARTTTPVSVGSEPVRQADSVSSYLKLTGLWPSKTQPLALINKTTFAPGEEAKVTVVVPEGRNKGETRKVLVKCLEVRQNSVLVSVDGEPGIRELLIQNKL